MRYDDKVVRRNASEIYLTQFINRGVPFVDQFGTPELRYPTAEEISELELVGHIWKLGDRYFKLSHKYYGESKYWWVIAWFNKRPTEFHIKTGQIIRIPLPLDRTLDFLDL